MLTKLKKNPMHYLLLLFIVLRMSWLTTMEPRGAAAAIKLHPDFHTMVGRAALTLPFVVYSSIITLTVILIGVLLKRYWAYLAALIFGIIHMILILVILLLRGNPRTDCPIIVICACTGMILFSLFTIKDLKRSLTA